MANIGEWDGDRLEIDMTGNSQDSIEIEFGQKLKKDIANSVQIIGIDLANPSGTFGIRVSNLSSSDVEYSSDFEDTLGKDITIDASRISQTYQTPYAYNTSIVKIDGVSGVNAGKFIIALNKD